MPSPEDAVRLRHMLEAAEKVAAFTQHRSRGDLDILWNIATHDLPALVTELKRLIVP